MIHNHVQWQTCQYSKSKNVVSVADSWGVFTTVLLVILYYLFIQYENLWVTEQKVPRLPCSKKKEALKKARIQEPPNVTWLSGVTFNWLLGGGGGSIYCCLVLTATGILISDAYFIQSCIQSQWRDNKLLPRFWFPLKRVQTYTTFVI